MSNQPDRPDSPQLPAYGSAEQRVSARAGDTPSTLFHYTSTAGLLGIVASGSLWATDIAYLNDRQEMKYGLALIRESILKIEGGRWAPEEAAIVLSLRELAPVMRVMVACFCEGGDLLGQWRGYGRSVGYAIGVETQALAAVFDRRQHFDALPFAQVIYDTDVSTDFARAAAEALMRAFSAYLEAVAADAGAEAGGSARAEGGKALFEFHQEHGITAALAATCLKDPAFAEEREWRLVRATYGAPYETPSPIRFREGPLGLTPFVALDLRGESGRVPLTEIVVSPGENADLRAAAAELLLVQHGYEADEVRVRISEVPWRP